MTSIPKNAPNPHSFTLKLSVDGGLTMTNGLGAVVAKAEEGSQNGHSFRMETKEGPLSITSTPESNPVDDKGISLKKSLLEFFSCKDWSKGSAMDLLFYNTGREARKIVTVDCSEILENWKAAVEDFKDPSSVLFGTVGKVVACGVSMLGSLAYGLMKIAGRAVKVLVATMPILALTAFIAASGVGIAFLSLTNPLLAIGVAVAVLALASIALGFMIKRICCKPKNTTDAAETTATPKPAAPKNLFSEGQRGKAEIQQQIRSTNSNELFNGTTRLKAAPEGLFDGSISGTVASSPPGLNRNAGPVIPAPSLNLSEPLLRSETPPPPFNASLHAGAYTAPVVVDQRAAAAAPLPSSPVLSLAENQGNAPISSLVSSQVDDLELSEDDEPAQAMLPKNQEIAKAVSTLKAQFSAQPLIASLKRDVQANRQPARQAAPANDNYIGNLLRQVGANPQ